MKKILALLKKARKYLGIALGYLKKLLFWGKKTDEALEEAQDKLKDEAKK